MWAGWEPPWEWGELAPGCFAEWVGFERSCWVEWEGNLVFCVGRGFVSEGGKDECLVKVAVPHLL